MKTFSQAPFSPYKLVSDRYKAVAGSEKIIENMPRIRSQDTLGLCYAFSSATLLQKFYCDDVKIQEFINIDKSLLPNYTDDELRILREQLNNARRTQEYFKYGPITEKQVLV